MKHTIIMNYAVLIKCQSIELPTERLEKSTAASSWATQDKEKLSTLHQPVELIQNALCWGVTVAKKVADTKGSREGRCQRVLELDRRSGA